MKPLDFPTHLDVEQWFTDEVDLPSGPTNSIFMVKAIDVNTNEEIYSIAMFVYWPREIGKLDFDEWRMICGANCFVRHSKDNRYNVVAWGKLKLKY